MDSKKDKVLYKDDWVSLIKKTNPENGDTYTIFSESNKVIILPYFIKNDGEIMISYLLEPISIWRNKKREITAISGTIEKGEDSLEAGIRELSEETGIVQKDKSKWHFVGSFFHSKSATSERFLYIVDILDSDIIKKSTDGSWFEKNTKNVVSPLLYVAKSKMNKDLYLSYLMMYLMNKLFYEKKN